MGSQNARLVHSVRSSEQASLQERLSVMPAASFREQPQVLLAPPPLDGLTPLPAWGRWAISAGRRVPPGTPPCVD